MIARATTKIAPPSAVSVLSGQTPQSSLEPVTGVLGPDEIPRAVDNIANSEIFLSSPQLVAFLSPQIRLAFDGRRGAVAPTRLFT